MGEPEKYALGSLPYFMKTISRMAITKSYSSYLPFPKEFFKQQSEALEREVTLKMARKKWQMKVGPVKNGGTMAFRAGWSQFAGDNNLVIGDQVVFTMLNGGLFTVKIIRADGSDDPVPTPVAVKQEVEDEYDPLQTPAAAVPDTEEEIKPVEETPVELTPVEQTPVEDTPVEDETPVKNLVPETEEETGFMEESPSKTPGKRPVSPPAEEIQTYRKKARKVSAPEISGSAEDGDEAETGTIRKKARKAPAAEGFEQGMETRTSARKAAERSLNAEQGMETRTSARKAAERSLNAEQGMETRTSARKAAERNLIAEQQGEETRTSARKAAERKSNAEQGEETRTAARKAAEKKSNAEQGEETRTAARKGAEKKSNAEQGEETRTAARKAAEKISNVEQGEETRTAARKAAEKSSNVEQGEEARKAAEKSSNVEQGEEARKAAEKSSNVEQGEEARKAAEKSLSVEKLNGLVEQGEQTESLPKSGDTPAAGEKTVGVEQGEQAEALPKDIISAELDQFNEADFARPRPRKVPVFCMKNFAEQESDEEDNEDAGEDAEVTKVTPGVNQEVKGPGTEQDPVVLDLSGPSKAAGIHLLLRTDDRKEYKVFISASAVETAANASEAAAAAATAAQVTTSVAASPEPTTDPAPEVNPEPDEQPGDEGKEPSPRIVIPMKTTNLAPYCRLGVEKAFAVKWMPQSGCNVTMVDEEGTEWSMKWVVGVKRMVTTGWAALAKEYNLKRGDQCSIEVIEPSLWKVSFTDDHGRQLSKSSELS